MSVKAKASSFEGDSKGEPEILDLIIIGGGISGALCAYDASLRGLHLALFEKSDFASGTSQATSRLIHGGLRYLKNFDFPLVLESLRERRIFARLAPHAISPMPFLLPIRRDRGAGFLLMGFGLRLYDFLSFVGHKNRGLRQGLRLPATRRLSAEEMSGLEALTQGPYLRGGFLYYDYANHSPERLTTEFLFAAKGKGATIQNYAEVTSIRYEEGLYWIKVFNRRTGTHQSYRSRSLLNATGPWADRALGLALSNTSKPFHLSRSKGIHVVTRRIAGDKTLVLMRPDGSHMFLIPLANRTLVGITDESWHGNPDEFQVTEDDIKNLLAEVNEACPLAALSLEDVKYFYGGLRPLVEESQSVSSYNASRKTEIEHHKDDGLPGFFSALGGKFTTSRSLAEKAINGICEFLQLDLSCPTKHSVLPAGDFANPLELFAELKAMFPNENPGKLAILASRYGVQSKSILQEFQATPKPLKKNRSFYKKGKQGGTGKKSVAKTQSRISDEPETIFWAEEGTPWYAEELSYILKHESVEHIDDLLFRRTSMGFLGRLPKQTEQALLDFTARHLAWDATRKRQEKKRLDLCYTPGAKQPS